MNRLAFQTYGTKKLSLFQSIWNTTETSAVGTELANTAATTPLPVGWAGANLLTGGYTHTAGNTASLLVNNLTPIAGQSYRIICTLSGTGSVVINWGGMSSVAIFATTTITLTPINITSKLSITPSNDFVGTVSLSIKQSSSATNQIQLPITVASGKSIWVDWGDGQYSTMNSANFYANRIHTYTASGEYPVRVFGDDFNFAFGSLNSSINDRLKIKSISSWGKLRIGLEAFSGCSNVTMSGITDIPDLTGVTNFQYLFGGCVSITSIGRINEWNTSSVTSMNYTFSGSGNFNSNISNWDVSNVLNMTSMFNGAAAFNQNLSNWERVGSTLSKVTNFGSMFQGATTFNNGSASGIANQLPWTINTTSTSVLMGNMFLSATAFNSNLGTGTTPWDVSMVTTFASMFNGASNFRNGDEVTQSKINDWNIGGSVTSVNTSGMFANASVFNRDISSWNMTKVTSTLNMFFFASTFNQPLSNWERAGSTMGNITDMSAMFQSASAFNQNIGNWDVEKVTSFRQMFQASGFNNNGSPTINNWAINTNANVTMASMFSSTGSFNQPLNSWNTSEVTDMSGTFSGSAFNNGLSSGVAGTLVWNTGKVTAMNSMFSVNSRFNCNIGNWDVGNCINFNAMFQEAGTFNNGGNSSINTWVLKETGDIDMTRMFYRTPAFNQPLGSWDTSRVTSMQEMFSAVSTTSIFNQDISKWNVGKVTNLSQMFKFATAFNNGDNSDINPITFLQGINGWNINTTAASVTMSQMFSSASAFNRNIGSWNVSKVTNFSDFMLSKTPANFSSTNLDAIYNGWIVNGVQPNTTSPLSTNISFGTAKYTAAGTPGRLTLTSAPNNWIIQDGGI